MEAVLDKAPYESLKEGLQRTVVLCWNPHIPFSESLLGRER